MRELRFVRAVLAATLAVLMGTPVAYAGGPKFDGPLENLVVDVGAFCGSWRIALPDGAEVAPEKISYGENCALKPKDPDKPEEKDSYIGSCDIEIEEGQYRLVILGLHRKLIFNINYDGWVLIQPPNVGAVFDEGTDKERVVGMAIGEPNEISLNIVTIDFQRNGFIGDFLFDGFLPESKGEQCIGMEANLPIGALWPLHIGNERHSWITVDQMGGVHVDAQYGIFRKKFANSRPLEINLAPVWVQIVPVERMEDVAWKIENVEDSFVKGAREILLIPGTSYKIFVGADHSVFDFNGPCQIAPKVLKIGADASGKNPKFEANIALRCAP